jgi:hypothetical protein
VNPLLKQYLEGTLASEGPMRYGQVTVTNSLGVPVQAGFLAPDGAVYPGPLAQSNTPVTGTRPVNCYWLAWTLDGALAAVYPGTAQAALSITIMPADLPSPGDIGPVPVPSVEVPIPNDSPSVLVATGRGRDSEGAVTYVARAQFWKRSGDSITLASKEEVTTSYTTMTGIQETSSRTETVAESVSASAAAGWGPVSASLSASLNTSTTSFQQYVSTRTDVRFESRTYNPEQGSRMIFRWQLFDVVTIWSAANKVLAQVTTAQQPDIVRVYKEADLVSRPRPELSEDDRRGLAELLAGLRAGEGAR